MPQEVQASANFLLSKGQHRTTFRNPRGLKYYYSIYYDTSAGQIKLEYSSTGWDGGGFGSTIVTADDPDSFDVKVRDDGSDLILWIVWHNGTNTKYRRGTIGDAASLPSWDSAQTIDGSVTNILAGDHCVAIARTDNAEVVVAYTEDFNTMGKDYRLVKLIGSDGDGASPSWSGETTWDNSSSNTNNQDKDEVWFGLETMSGDRVFLYARVPESTDGTNYEVATAVPTWGGSSFANTTANKAISGPHDNDGKVISGVVDAADRAHLIYYDGTNTRLDSRKAASVDDDDWGSASTVKSADVDACTLTLDAGPATDELYAFYHDVADTTGFHYKTTPIDTISWSSEETVTFASDLIALTSWSRDIENSLHIGIEDADTDVWYYEHVLTVPADPIPDRLYKVEQHINRSGTY